MSRLVVFSFDDQYLEGQGQVKCMLNHLSSGIPMSHHIMYHLSGLNLDLQAAVFELLLEGRTVYNLISESTKLWSDKKYTVSSETVTPFP